MSVLAYSSPGDFAYQVPIKDSFGLGLDSVAILLRWLTEPETLIYGPLSAVTLVTAMTGDEYDDTRRLMERHILPRLRERHIRFVQISRGVSGGYVVLDDSRSPKQMIMEGPWRLRDEYAESGTMPQLSSRRCSAHAKGEPLDAWTRDEYGDGRHLNILGFAVGEEGRAVKDAKHRTAQRLTAYPLLDWGWSRAQADAYIYDRLGVRWPKSACLYCPFAYRGASAASLAQRWSAEPRKAADALSLEYVALALNERSGLFGEERTAADFAREQGLEQVLDLHERELADAEWCLYDVRRITWARTDPAKASAKGPAWRSTRRLATGSRAAVHERLRQRAQKAGASVLVDEHGISRAQIIPRSDGPYPAIDRAMVLAPAVPRDKQRDHFETHWRDLAARRGLGSLAARNPRSLTPQGDSR